MDFLKDINKDTILIIPNVLKSKVFSTDYVNFYRVVFNYNHFTLNTCL